MSNSEYGNLGKDMAKMKNQRTRGMASVRSDRRKRSGEVSEILADGRRIVAQAGDLLATTGKANSQLQAQTRKALSTARAELREVGQQTRAMTGKTAANVHRDVVALKADAGRIVAGAAQFMADTRRSNEQLRAGARQIVADAAATVSQFADRSRQRASDWQDIIRAVRSAGSTTTTAAVHPATKSRGNGKSHKSGVKAGR